MAKRYLNRDWKNSMRIRLDYNNMMSEFVGEKEGFTTKMINAERSKALSALAKVKASRGKGWLGWMDLPFNQADIVKDVNETAKVIRKTAKNFVVLGIGGSALGPIAVFQALSSSRCGKQFLVIRKCIHKLSAYVSPTTTTYRVSQFVVTVESVADHIAVVVSEEL